MEEIDKRRRVDVTVQVVQELQKEGLSKYAIAKKLHCSSSVIKLRINEGKLSSTMDFLHDHIKNKNIEEREDTFQGGAF